MVNLIVLHATVDAARGGRWTSLRAGDREWLWHRPDPARDDVRPDQDFVDAGGLEECVPTVRGNPDHGAAWTRSWRELPDGATVVECPEFELTRHLRHEHGAVIAGYRLAAAPGWRFIWTAHALLDLSDAALIHAPHDTVTRVYADPGDDAAWQAGPWPSPLGQRLDTCGPADGSAVGAILTDCRDVRVSDGHDELRLRLEADPQPVSVALWRNLRGFPAGGPYRSIGVEPMLGRVFDLTRAGAGDAATVPPSGTAEWQLTLTAARRSR